MDIVAVIAENKIREAMEKGEFDNLPGKGKPLQLEDLSGVPEELRASYLILKNAGVLPPELELHREILSLKKLIDFCYQEEERQDLTRKLNEKILRFNLLMERRGMNAAVNFYQEKIYRKLGRGYTP
ncbi:DnaJ-like, subfamily C, domain-containing protein [Desulfofundulus kuznetsovii DSM 6115]|uniref:DnaJ-like, subfamily C, domain-containing protein n=1 Tax=Desulfofundulus kuznetsovii (strain DSM 6115 / VKM B-1805 / 17) TaxID=760568 RepID=A0AAU8PDC3_DESK7|nr:DnaJ-like, subfamily C, domain-containing protein [Desulfofundulus kuznetsovii DSM 6115]